jgi:hypothetical protein
MPMTMNPRPLAPPPCSYCSFITYISLHINFNMLMTSYAVICQDGPAIFQM